MDYDFYVVSKNSSPNLWSAGFFPMLSSGSFSFTLYIYSGLFCINFCKKAKGLCLDLFSACDCPVVLASFFEKKKLSFLHCIYFTPL